MAMEDTGADGSGKILILLAIALIGSNVFWFVKHRGNRLHYAKGIEHIQEKRFTEAASRFDQAIWQNPDDPSAHFGLAWTHQMTGRTPESVQHYNQAIFLSGSVLGYALNNLQFIRQNEKNTAEAEKLQKARDALKVLEALR